MEIEKNFSMLDELIRKLEEENISLENAFEAYSKGMEILKDCSRQVDRVEKKVLKMNGLGETEELEEMEKGQEAEDE